MSSSSFMFLSRPLKILAVALALAGCATAEDTSVQGTDSPADAGGSATSTVDAGTTSATCIQTLVSQVEPHLSICRSCHSLGGIAGPTRFNLSTDPSEDTKNLQAAWNAIGSDVLSVPSTTNGRTHTGGDLWPVGSPGYDAMAALLAAFGDPASCVPSTGGGTDLPVLGSSHGGHSWNAFCVGKSDDTPLPIDPRTLVQPGVNVGKAAVFNAYWVDCHVGAAPEDAAPKTCGEYRTRLTRGQDMMENGRMWFFGGNYTDAIFSMTADNYNNLWAQWGLPSRPADFDERVANRWGVPLGTKRNPYPLPGEDPNVTNGGSGQLPVALTQLRELDGKYTGKIGFNCNWCHSGKAGDPSDGPGLGAMYGNGNSLVDIGAAFRDAFNGLGALFPIAANKSRGTGDILLYPAIAALDVDRALHYNPSLAIAPSQGSVDYPPFWNVGHRTRRFHDGSFAMDDGRPVMGFFMPIGTVSHLLDIPFGRNWIEQRDQDVQVYLESLKAPAYPGPVDTSLAEAGAVIFHNKNLWSPELGNPVSPPAQGNGSCASCHGVYAPRFVNDTRYLDRPELEGIAADVVPMSVIGTDPARFNSLNDGLKDMLSWSWWAYGTVTTRGACFGTVGEGGYLAPPLHGVWATAPYLHNGSVPNIWEVLKPSDRKEIWRRVSTPPPSTDPTAFMGFDTNFTRAYDQQKLGWKYDALACGDPGTQPWLDCSPGTTEYNPLTQTLLSTGFSTLWFTWNLGTPPYDAAALEQRKVYNTHQYSQGNQGHAFTSVLTDDERRALVEYLKTL